MARGYLSGMIAGTVVSGLALAGISVSTQIPTTGAPEATALEVPAGSEFDQSRDDVQAELPQAQETPDAPEAPRVDAPVPDDLSSIDPADTRSAALPETGGSQEVMTAPKAGDATGGVDVDTESPVLPSPQAEAPAVPTDEETLSISTEPAQPPQPELPEEELELPEEDVSISVVPAQPQMPDAGDEETAFPTSVEESSPADDAGDTAQNTAPADVADGATPQTDAGMTKDEMTVISDNESNTTPKVAPTDVVTGSQNDAVAMAVPDASGTIENLAPEVKTDRLPSVGEAPEPEEGAENGASVADDSSLPPLQRYAAEFENPDDKPLMSIVLIDDGSSPIGLDALQSFPYPLSFAVDTGWTGAQEAMRTYRDAGFEVLAMVDLPAQANAVDTEVAMQDLLSKMPEAVAVMEGQGTGLQSSREASAQLAEIFRDSGHGVVMLPNGLNTAQKLIAREGVPALSVFRDFDAKGQNAAVIRRFLDQAAFKAGQEENGVIMVGRLRADTISALLLWGLQDRASRVALAPVSAVLQQK